MLQAQVNYWNLVEQRRHNIEQEAIAWANTMLEQLKYEETKRHNLSTEQLEIKKLAETIRHNMVSENQADVNNGIQAFLAQTKQGELTLKQLTEPIKANASMLSAQGSYIKGTAAATTATAKQREVANAWKTKNRELSLKSSKQTQDYNVNLERNRIEARKVKVQAHRSKWEEKAAQSKAVNDALSNAAKAVEIMSKE